MFTGLVQSRGELLSSVSVDEGRRVAIAASDGFMVGVAIGDSIAVNGVCLTVTGVEGELFRADVSAATLAATTLGGLAGGAKLNLERAVTPATALGGHLVTGHVDGVAHVVDVAEAGESRRLRVAVPARLARYIATKGSVCVDGVSLTVNAIDDAEFEVNLVPHTLAATNLGMLSPGATVNLEVDLIARYVERLMGRE